MSLSPSLRPLTVEPLRAAFRCTTSHWPGTRPRRATFFLVVRQERRQRNVPRCRAPFGGSLLPGPSGGVCANSPCGLKHAQPFFRLPNPPVGAPEGRGNAGAQRPVPDSSSAGARCIRKARSDPAEQRTSRRGLPARLFEPEGRVPRRPPAGSSAGQSFAQRMTGVAGSPFLPSYMDASRVTSKFLSFGSADSSYFPQLPPLKLRQTQCWRGFD